MRILIVLIVLAALCASCFPVWRMERCGKGIELHLVFGDGQIDFQGVRVKLHHQLLVEVNQFIDKPRPDDMLQNAIGLEGIEKIRQSILI